MCYKLTLNDHICGLHSSLNTSVLTGASSSGNAIPVVCLSLRFRLGGEITRQGNWLSLQVDIAALLHPLTKCWLVAKASIFMARMASPCCASVFLQHGVVAGVSSTNHNRLGPT